MSKNTISSNTEARIYRMATGFFMPALIGSIILSIYTAINVVLALSHQGYTIMELLGYALAAAYSALLFWAVSWFVLYNSILSIYLLIFTVVMELWVTPRFKGAYCCIFGGILGAIIAFTYSKYGLAKTNILQNFDNPYIILIGAFGAVSGVITATILKRHYNKHHIAQKTPT